MISLQQHPCEVSVELMSPYRNLTRESDKETGAGHGPSTMWRISPERILCSRDYKPKICFPIWENKLFIIPCAFAVLFNPLFIYLPVTYPHLLCYQWDVSLMWIYVALQSTIDLFYAMDIFVFCWRIRGNQNVNMTVKEHIFLWLPIIYRIYLFLPISQLFGALWYGFAVDRELHCWRKQYNLMQCDKSVRYSFYCDKNITAQVLRTCNATHIKAFCDPTDKKDFNFGIYRYALQSNFTRSTYFPRKFLQSFWWGLRNLSSFGSNLETSSDMLETSFSILTSISGLVLFLIYLNARVEEAQKRKDRIKLRHKMQMMNPDIDMWLTRNNFSRRDKKLMKKVIMKNVQQKLEENKDVDLDNFLSLLPREYKRQIMSLSRLTCLQKVPMFKYMKIRVLKAIAKHLELVTYTKNCHIIREGEALWNVFFITQGTALSYKTRNNANVGGTKSDSSIIKKDDFFGDELLDWAFVFASISDLPVSTKTVISQTRVEAYAISATNLRRVVSKFRLHFILNLPVLEHSPLEHMAASSLQASWRERGNHNRWNKLRELLNNSSEAD